MTTNDWLMTTMPELMKFSVAKKEYPWVYRTLSGVVS